eukprot:scaffold241560_cov42-Prasinocladus_malaysianus.AAC.1
MANYSMLISLLEAVNQQHIRAEQSNVASNIQSGWQTMNLYGHWEKALRTRLRIESTFRSNHERSFEGNPVFTQRRTVTYVLDLTFG